jgi:hypothetical protein
MRNTACPNIVSCTVNAQLANSGVSLSTNIPIEQNCGGGSTNNTSTNDGSTSDTVMYMWVLIFVLIVAIVCGVAFTPGVYEWLSGGKKEGTEL